MEDSAVQQAAHLLSWTGHHKLWQDFVQANSCTETSRNLRAQDSLRVQSIEQPPFHILKQTLHKIASEYHSITWSGLLQVKQNLTKGFQWTALGFVCPHWISSFNLKIFKLKLEISEFRSTSVGQSWAVRLLRRAPCREAGSATWHPSLSIRWLDQQQRSRCADRCCWSSNLRDRDYEIHKLEGFSFLIFPSQCARAQHFVLDGYKC